MLAPVNAVLNCIVEGFPLPTVSWVMVNDNGNQRPVTDLISSTNSAFLRDSSLIISRTNLTLNGVYVCVATNEVGSINASAVLTVNGEMCIFELYSSAIARAVINP